MPPRKLCHPQRAALQMRDGFQTCVTPKEQCFPPARHAESKQAETRPACHNTNYSIFNAGNSLMRRSGRDTLGALQVPLDKVP